MHAVNTGLLPKVGFPTTHNNEAMQPCLDLAVDFMKTHVNSHNEPSRDFGVSYDLT